MYTNTHLSIHSSVHALSILHIHYKSICLFIYLSIYEMYTAPLQDNHSEALPHQEWPKRKVM